MLINQCRLLKNFQRTLIQYKNMQKQQYLPDIGSLKEDKELIWTSSMCWLWSCAIKICPQFLITEKVVRAAPFFRDESVSHSAI